MIGFDLYEIKAKGYGSAYMTADGRYMIQGEIIELNGAKLTNIYSTSFIVETADGKNSIKIECLF